MVLGRRALEGSTRLVCQQWGLSRAASCGPRGGVFAFRRAPGSCHGRRAGVCRDRDERDPVTISFKGKDDGVACPGESCVDGLEVTVSNAGG